LKSDAIIYGCTCAVEYLCLFATQEGTIGSDCQTIQALYFLLFVNSLILLGTPFEHLAF